MNFLKSSPTHGFQKFLHQNAFEIACYITDTIILQNKGSYI